MESDDQTLKTKSELKTIKVKDNTIAISDNKTFTNLISRKI